MHNLSDISFCEVADKDIEIQGGYILALNLKDENLRSLIKNLFSSPLLVEYDGQQVDSNLEVVVDKLNNNAIGNTGYLMSSEDGKFHFGVVIGRNSIQSFASSST